MAADASSLPRGWTEHTDPASGKVFFHNASTGATAWERPHASGWTEQLDPSSGKTFYHNASTGQVSWERPHATAALPVDWIEQWDPASEKSFYHNAFTGEVQWERPQVAVQIPVAHPQPVPTATGSIACQSAGKDVQVASAQSQQLLKDDEYLEWSRGVFLSLGGCRGRMIVDRVRGRAVNEWLRGFINDAVMSGDLPRRKAVPTARIVKLLIAKAEQNESGHLMEDEFYALIRVTRQSRWQGSLEAELVWSLITTPLQKEEIGAADFDKLRACWQALGKVCSDADAAAVHAAAKKEDRGVITQQRYESWLLTSCVEQQPKSLVDPPEAAKNSIQPKVMSLGHYTVPSDHLCRSSEAKHFSLVTAPINLALEVLNFTKIRGLRPSRPSTARSRKAAPADAESVNDFHILSPSPIQEKVVQRASPRLKQQRPSSCNVRKGRLRPYMEVKSPMTTPDGKIVFEIGTLMSGWGVKNPATKIPHSEAPENENRKARAAQKAADPRQDQVRVLISGIEKWVPRAAVVPLQLLEKKPAGRAPS